MFSVLYPQNKFESQVYAVMGYSGKKPWEITRCQICKRILSKEQVNDLAFEIYGLYIRDFVWSDDDTLVSEDFAEKLKTSGLEGFAFREVDIVNWHRNEPAIAQDANSSQKEGIPRLLQLIITGKGGSILKMNHARIISQCPVCNTTVYKLYGKGLNVDKNVWDNSDIFVMDEFPGIILITEKFSKWLESNRISNYETFPAEQFDLDDLGVCVSR